MYIYIYVYILYISTSKILIYIVTQDGNQNIAVTKSAHKTYTAIKTKKRYHSLLCLQPCK